MGTLDNPQDSDSKDSFRAKKYPTSQKEDGVVVLNNSNEPNSLTAKVQKNTTYQLLKNMILPHKQNSHHTKKTWKTKSFKQHAIYTIGWLIGNAPHYKNLTKLEIVLLKLFWTRRSFSNSHGEIATHSGLPDKKAAFLLMNQLAALGFLDIKKQTYREYYKGRSYYKLTYKGQKLIKMILNKAFKSVVISPEFFPLEMHGNYSNFRKVTRESLRKAESSKNKSKRVSKLLLVPRTNKRNMLEQSADCGNFSFEEGKFLFDWGIFASLPYQILAKRVSSCYDYAQKHPGQLGNLRARDLKREFDYFKTCERRSIFKKFGFAKAYDNEMHIGIWRILEKEPVEKIGRALKAMRNKLANGYKIKSFTGFFTHLIKKERVVGFGAFRAAVYRDAIDGMITAETKRILQGHDSSLLVGGIREIEKETGEKVGPQTLHRVLSNQHKALKGLEAVRYRKKKYIVKSWVAMWVWAIKFNSIEDIHKNFFVKKEHRDPRLFL